MIRRRTRRRGGLSTLEVVMTTAVSVPAALLLYLMAERVLDGIVFLITTSVGAPYL